MEPLSNYITLSDCLLSAFYAGIIFFCVWVYNKVHPKNETLSRYLSYGLAIKMFGGIAFTLVYAFYYGGGDINSYFYCTRSLVNLTPEDFGSVFKMLMGNNSYELREQFTAETGYPYMYIFFDNYTWSVCRFTYPFMLLSFNQLLSATILLDAFSFIGIWQFYRMLVRKYPYLKTKMFFVSFLIPSCIFWGSGLSKDIFTFSAFLWAIASVINISDKKCNVFTNVLLLIFNSYVIISIKPYIFIAMIPFIVVIIIFDFLKNIKNNLLRRFVAPMLLLVICGIAIIVYYALSESLGVYGDIDSMMNKASLTQSDMSQNQVYGENKYDIGYLDVSFWGFIEKIPISLYYGMFGPFLWDSTSIFIFLSALESTTLIVVVLYIIFKFKFRKYWKIVSSDPYLLGSIFFLFIFLFFVGLTSANYGALVRYRIQALPILWSFLMVLINYKNKKLV